MQHSVVVASDRQPEDRARVRWWNPCGEPDLHLTLADVDRGWLTR